ncbi:MAG: 2'-deoxycytidine 5'-triphosphate deaminase [Planctomycetes bacterium]|nr:2'-deoxycytidine 5'-triphosphate deaminase [Planctomycetota bacterium]
MASGVILVDHELARLLGTAIRPAPLAPGFTREQLQPTSLDLRLGARAHRIRAGFLPEHVSIEERLSELSIASVSLEEDGGVLERGSIYLVPLEEELELPPELAARFNPRSSTGRTDLFTRVLVPGFPRFDEAPPGYRGRLWLEVAPLSFAVRLRRGDRLCQMRLARGPAALSTGELFERCRKEALCFEGARALSARELRFDDDGGLLLCIGLAGRDPCGWRATHTSAVVEFAAIGAHASEEFWEPVRARGGHCVLEPGRFYLFASRERIRIPLDLAAEMLPVDVGIGELRNNYAGFFDSGFGGDADGADGASPRGTPAVLEVRAHDLPFLVEEGQVFFRLKFFRTSGAPERPYGRGRDGPSYADQDLTLARSFRPAR